MGNKFRESKVYKRTLTTLTGALFLGLVSSSGYFMYNIRNNLSKLDTSMKMMEYRTESIENHLTRIKAHYDKKYSISKDKLYPNCC